MKALRAALLALVFVLTPPPANAGPCPPLTSFTVVPPSNVRVEAVDLRALQPFCRAEAFHPVCQNIDGTQPTSATVARIDSAFRERFEYRNDDLAFGKPDHWSSKVVCGDCEDYALGLARLLAASGVGGKHMALIAWMPSDTTAHMTLAVRTSDMGWMEIGVNNSERPEPLKWDKGRRFAWMLMDGKQKWIFKDPIGS